MQNEPPDHPIENKSDQTWPYHTNSFGTSFGIKQPQAFEPPKVEQKPPHIPIRGGIQVLPPVVPPRAVNGSIPNQSTSQPANPVANQANLVNQPVATPRPKPKPPLPPKRDELTRLTTVKREPPPPPVRSQSISDHKPAEKTIPDVVPAHEVQEEPEINPSVEETELNQTPPEIPPRPEESALRVIHEPDPDTFQNLDTVVDLPEPDLPKSDVDLTREDSLDSPSSEDGATADIWVRAIESPIKKRPSGDSLSSQALSRHTSTSGDDAEDKDSKPPIAKESQSLPKHRVVLDKSYIKCLKDNDNTKSPTKTEEALPPTIEESGDNSEVVPAQSPTSKSVIPNVQKESNRAHPRPVVGTESLPCSRPSSRTTSRSSSPASFVSEKQSSKKISAAEALGVVAKPCPRPPSSKRSKQPQEYRRQSLGNLSDSKLSIGYDKNNCSISCTIRGLWSSVGETEVVSETGREYRRHERAHRGSSADGTRTLSRIKFDCGHPTWEGESLKGYLDRDTQSVSGYGTLSRIGRTKDKYFARSTTPVLSGYSSGDSASIKEDLLSKKNQKVVNKLDTSGRPKSTCNCGHHSGSSVRETGKRTFSVEELTSAFSRQCSEFTRGGSGSGSARGSFGKSPRVTFALAEDMGASGGAISKHSEPDRVAGGASKKILRGKSLPNPGTDSDDGMDPRISGLQHMQFQGGGSLPPPSQSNRSQPAIGLKQTPKTRPTIFGTVASDLTPKEGGSCRRSLPQTNGGGVELHEPSPEPTADPDNALVYRDGNLVSGSLDALTQHMVPTTDYYPDRAYLFAFLLSSRLYVKPHELLGRVTAMCDSQQKFNDKHPAAKERLMRFIPRLVQLMAEWSETFPYDFRDERVMAHVRAITQTCVGLAGPAGEARVRHEVSTLLQNLLHRLTALEKYEEFLQRVGTESTTSNIEALNMTDVTDVCPNASALAQQLTHIELERLSFIGPEEFVQAFAKENPQLETSFKDMKKTRNLESYVSWFNRLSYFVATEVVKHAKKKQRVRVVEFWIETARECFNIGNFNSLMAIIAGLNMSPISRLKKTWNKVQSAKFSVLEHQMDPSSNFCNYRSTLKAAMWRSAGATDQSQRIVIPFFSLLVKDLYFLNEGCSNKLPNGHINFEKFWQLAKQVTEFITWKQVTCPFEKNPKVITFLQASPVLTENALALASFECEPPENSLEKERCKSLKTWYAETNCRFCRIEAYKRRKESTQARHEHLNTSMAVCSDVMFQYNMLRGGEPVPPATTTLEPPVSLGAGLPTFDPPTPADFFNILAEMTS